MSEITTVSRLQTPEFDLGFYQIPGVNGEPERGQGYLHRNGVLVIHHEAELGGVPEYHVIRLSEGITIALLDTLEAAKEFVQRIEADMDWDALASAEQVIGETKALVLNGTAEFFLDWDTVNAAVLHIAKCWKRFRDVAAAVTEEAE